MDLLVCLLALSVGWASAVSPYLQAETEVGNPVDQGLKTQDEQRERLKTISVSCHPDSLEITMKADLFDLGAPVYSDELRLGAEQRDQCRARPTPGGDYIILLGLTECGTKHWVTEDALVYTNLLVFSPRVNPDGLIRLDEAVIPIECQYKR